MKKTMPIIFFAVFSFFYFGNIAVSLAQAPAGAVNVANYGAVGDGVKDDTKALTDALNYCVANKKVCYIPKSKSFYHVTGTIRVDIKPSQKLEIVSNGGIVKAGTLTTFKSTTLWKISPMYDEKVLLSFGPAAANYTDLSTAFAKNNGTTLIVKGLIIDGVSEAFPEVPEKNQRILVGLQTSCANVNISSCSFSNIYGYGMVSFGAQTYINSGSTYREVGGRGKTPYAFKVDTDAFGDAIYTAVVKPGANITIRNCNLTGIQKFKRRSRIGITFEYSKQPYRITIDGCKIRHYAKGIHYEEKAKSTTLINNCLFEDVNFGVANIGNAGSTSIIRKSVFNIGTTDGQEQGDAYAFLTMYGDVNISVENSQLNFKGRKGAFQNFAGVKKVINTTLNANNTNPSIANANTQFESCKFINFGGNAPSFTSYAGGNSFLLKNCTFEGGDNVHAKGQKLSLKFDRTVSKSGKQLIAN
jgi:hypothetical protein